ncbi:MAG: hypothetical protein WC455_24580 [Dehalococcoidia bacterium]|jgi:hypothetical protein
MPDKPIVTEHKCPCCGLDQPLTEEARIKMVAAGYMRPEYKIYFQIFDCLIVDPQLQNKIPIGYQIPRFQAAVTICGNCGALYAKQTVERVAKKQAPVILPPGSLNNPPGRN